MVEIIFGLDPNIIFAVVVGGTLSATVAKLWQRGSQKFNNKVNVLNELQTIFKTHQKARQFIHNKINHKYFTFNKTKIVDGKSAVELLPRQTPLSHSLVETYEEFRMMDSELSTLPEAYTILFRNKKTDKLTSKREKLFGQLIITYFDVCHTEKSSTEISDIIKPTLPIIYELKELERQIILEYINSFSFWYKLNKNTTYGKISSSRLYSRLKIMSAGVFFTISIVYFQSNLMITVPSIIGAALLFVWDIHSQTKSAEKIEKRINDLEEKITIFNIQ